MKKLSRIINIFGAPGAGKSTVSSQIFSELKYHNVSCELVNEFAKDLTWSERHRDLRVQPYIFGKQLLRLERLIGKVDYIITDSPLLLSLVYTNESWPLSFSKMVVDIFHSFSNLNFLIKRTKPYIQSGRNQTEIESDILYTKIHSMLESNNINYKLVSDDLRSFGLNLSRDIINAHGDIIHNNGMLMHTATDIR